MLCVQTAGSRSNASRFFGLVGPRMQCNGRFNPWFVPRLPGSRQLNLVGKVQVEVRPKVA